ncbi:MAG: DUF1624 domain-containing protein [Deltaproteobacteria bacterium]|nr:DUF1624 domain-containing protein [Deltaproteobacteria bacterium]
MAASKRRLFIDWARGFAVLCMIQHHAFDAWMPDSFHGSPPDHFFRFMGGVAAPTFLFLAGVAMVMMMEAAHARGQSRREAAWTACKRGFGIFVAAHLFRFQQWALWWGAAPWTDLVRIDVLNCIGIALMLTAGVWSLGPSRRARALLFFIACAVVVVCSPWIWAADLSRWPWLAADYVKGLPPRALFPLFPWIAFAFAGALPGLLLAQIRAAKDPDRFEARVVIGLSLGSVALWFATRFVDGLDFHLYANLEWWRTSPAYFILRCCSELWLIGVCWLVERAFAGFWASRKHLGPLVLLGRHSLLVYWVHIEIVYGRWFWGQRGKLSLAQAATWVVVVIAAMVALSWAAERFDEWRAARKKRPATPAAAIA